MLRSSIVATTTFWPARGKRLTGHIFMMVKLESYTFLLEKILNFQ